MKRFLLTAATLALLTTAAQAASPGYRLYSGGYWQTTYFPRNDDGNQMCSMRSQWTFVSTGETGTVFIKYSVPDGLFMHITKSSWHLTPGQDVPMTVTFDTGAREVTGRTKKSRDGWTMIEVGVPQDKAFGFLDDVGEADQLTVEFPQGNETPWSGKMLGSRNAKNWFVACMAKVSAVATQPVLPENAQPTQPKPTTSEMLFTIPSDVSAGHMNVRNGPGANHGLLGAIPADKRLAPRAASGEMMASPALTGASLLGTV